MRVRARVRSRVELPSVALSLSVVEHALCPLSRLLSVTLAPTVSEEWHGTNNREGPGSDGRFSRPGDAARDKLLKLSREKTETRNKSSGVKAKGGTQLYSMATNNKKAPSTITTRCRFLSSHLLYSTGRCHWRLFPGHGTLPSHRPKM